MGHDEDRDAGIAGLNWQVKMISLKSLNAIGSGYISDAVLAFDKIAERNLPMRA